MEPMFRFTGAEDFPDKLKCIVSGSPKSGKSSLLGTVPNIVIADTEPQANNLQSLAHLNIPYKTIHTSDDLAQLHTVLADSGLRAAASTALGLPQIDAVAIDTLDTYQQILKRERLKDNRRSDFGWEDWGWLREQMITTVRNFTALPLHVFFCLHTKTKEIGKGDDARTVVLPALEGSIDEVIAGMVGYSLLCFRRQEVRQDGSPYTKYWLRAEGDETYAYLGNRAAGRLPDIMEPNFQTIYAAAMDGRSRASTPRAGVDLPGVPENVQQAPPQDQTPQDAPPQQAPPQQAPPQDQAADDEPVNAAALGHVKRVFDTLQIPFPKTAVEKMNIGQARALVMHWRACQDDEKEGKLPEGGSAFGEMRTYLEGIGLVEYSGNKYHITWNASEVLTWAGRDPERIQEAYDKEMGRKAPRTTLVTALVERGATPAPTTEGIEAAERAQLVEHAPSPEKAAEQAEEALPAELPNSGSSADRELQQAAQNLTDAGMNPAVSAIDTPEGSCEDCQNPINDPDIAVLAQARYQKKLCVECYIAQNRK